MHEHTTVEGGDSVLVDDRVVHMIELEVGGRMWLKGWRTHESEL